MWERKRRKPQTLPDRFPTRFAHRKVTVVIVSGRHHANLFGWYVIVFDDEIELRWSRHDNETAVVVKFTLVANAAGKIVLSLEVFLRLREILFHLALFPQAK